MGKWGGLDKRRFPRIKFPCLVVIRENDCSNTDEKDNTVLAHTENVAVGGVCVSLKRTVKTFSVVKIELDLLDLDNHICCDGKVVWNVKRTNEDENKRQNYDVGIEFIDLAEKDRERLEKVINRLVENET